MLAHNCVCLPPAPGREQLPWLPSDFVPSAPLTGTLAIGKFSPRTSECVLQTNLAPFIISQYVWCCFVAATLLHFESISANPVLPHNPRGWDAAKQALGDQPQAALGQQARPFGAPLQQAPSTPAALPAPAHSLQGLSQAALCLALAGLGFGLGWYLRGTLDVRHTLVRHAQLSDAVPPAVSPAAGQQSAAEKAAPGIAEQQTSAGSTLSIVADAQAFRRHAGPGSSEASHSQAADGQAATGDSAAVEEGRVSEPDSPGVSLLLISMVILCVQSRDQLHAVQLLHPCTSRGCGSDICSIR